MMATIHRLPTAPMPMAAVARILERFDRHQVEAFITVAIDLLDTLDGDPDREDDDPDREDDDPPGQCDEDEVNTDFLKLAGDGPGCQISDDCGGHEYGQA